MGRSIEVIEINDQLLHVKGELLCHYNLLKKQGSAVVPTMIKNAYLGVHQEKQTLLQVVDFHNGKFKEKVDKGKRENSTYKKWLTTKDKITAFLSGVLKMKDIPLERIEFSFAEDFFDYLTLTEGIQDNTAMKYLKNTKQLLKLAVQRNGCSVIPCRIMYVPISTRSGIYSPWQNSAHCIIKNFPFPACRKQKTPTCL
ncbi:phage integrase SAM-like domain-containing protein [Chitinophaga polysaccharea]|uniref:phage integrase SAM-like domain-containing protein n=1 Tax=Chitinophaga polysaccharea TaxID=1293035 RepID=UPI00163CB0FC|nr:phage integrase SAM-like domain-containing protein [Chitinophaga polysaccharea]